jgi:hypothetical protein
VGEGGRDGRTAPTPPPISQINQGESGTQEATIAKPGMKEGRKEGVASVPLVGGHGGGTECGPARRPACLPLRPLMRERLLYRICLQSGGGGGHVGDGERQ